jgi:pyruvate/2-oxoglutarate dehydrogenase complex dihydrolipoamide acyltransferase (E2) component
MTNIITSSDLWASSMLPEGILERWLVLDGTIVTAGQCIAEVRIEGSLHEITAPVSGHLKTQSKFNAIIEPGSIIATVEP